MLGLDDLDAVGESDTGDDLRQLICAFQSTPGFRGRVDELTACRRNIRAPNSIRPAPLRKDCSLDIVSSCSRRRCPDKHEGWHRPGSSEAADPAASRSCSRFQNAKCVSRRRRHMPRSGLKRSSRCVSPVFDPVRSAPGKLARNRRCKSPTGKV